MVPPLQHHRGGCRGCHRIAIIITTWEGLLSNEKILIPFTGEDFLILRQIFLNYLNEFSFNKKITFILCEVPPTVDRLDSLTWTFHATKAGSRWLTSDASCMCL